MQGGMAGDGVVGRGMDFSGALLGAESEGIHVDIAAVAGGDVGRQPLGRRGIGFERKYTALRTREPGGHERPVAVVRTAVDDGVARADEPSPRREFLVVHAPVQQEFAIAVRPGCQRRVDECAVVEGECPEIRNRHQGLEQSLKTPPPSLKRPSPQETQEQSGSRVQLRR